jgi:hypothetical protein
MLQRGRQMARVLAGCWRARPEALDLSESAVAELISDLQACGAGALAWAVVRSSSCRSSPRLKTLQQIYRWAAVENAWHERNLQNALLPLQTAGVPFIYIKGWTCSSLYAEAGLRPRGDIDLCVRPGQLAAVRDLLTRCPEWVDVDLHEGVPDVSDRTWDQVWSHSRLLRFGRFSVAVLGPEDELRLLCLHFMRHGGYRPVWLCDIAAAVEKIDAGFDWEYFISGDRRLTCWCQCAMRLAGELLGAHLPDAVSSNCGPAPRWLVNRVLRTWGAGRFSDSHNRDTLPLLAHWRRPWRILGALHDRWPNAIEAAFKMGAYPATKHRLWYQIRAVFDRAWYFPAKCARRWAEPVTPCPQALSIHSAS